jgi:hypothetical protein
MDSRRGLSCAWRNCRAVSQPFFRNIEALDLQAFRSLGKLPNEPETSEANGGTARIVAHRRAGCPDAIGVAVARRSSVLRHERSEVLLSPAGYVWLMAASPWPRTRPG